MKILVVDDEPPARMRLTALVGDVEGGSVVGEAGNGPEALRLATELAPDIVLLDIRMPGMDGLEVARHLAAMDTPPAVIFTTAYDSHALAAFDAQAVDYLLKPIRRERLAQALERARSPTRAQLAELQDRRPEGSAARTHLSATLHGELRLVPVESVRFLRAEHKYVTVYFPGGELIVDESLSALEEEFAEHFLRVHRNTLVAPAYVRGMVRDGDGPQQLVIDGVDERVAVSRRLAAGVRKSLAGSVD